MGVPSSVIAGTGSVEAPVALGVPSSVIAGTGSVEAPESLGELSSTLACGTISGSSRAGGASSLFTRRIRTVGSFAAGMLSPTERRFLLRGVPVARLSAAPGSLSASSDEEAPVSSHHEVGTGPCSGRPVSRHRCAMMHHTLPPMWSWAS